MLQVKQEMPKLIHDDGISRDPFTPYRVSHWSNHPCDETGMTFGGKNYATEAEAIDAYHTDTTNYHVQYVSLDGPDFWHIRRNPFFSGARAMGFDAWFESEPARYYTYEDEMTAESLR